MSASKLQRRKRARRHPACRDPEITATNSLTERGKSIVPIPASCDIKVDAISYPNGISVDEHCHYDAQLIYAVSGVMEVCALNKLWRIPPQRAVWMPPRLAHKMQAIGVVELRTAYVPAGMTPKRFSKSPQIIAVSPLLRELVLRGIEISQDASNDGMKTRILSLISEEVTLLLEESAKAPDRSLPLPTGSERCVTKICDAIIENPGHPRSLEEWAKSVGASKRTLARKFQAEFGMSFLHWRQQVRVVAALSRLDQGDQVTSIASDLGYETTAAFSLMFRRITGVPPSKYTSVTGPRLHDGSTKPF